MLRRLTAVLMFALLATPAAADTRYLSFNPADRITTALTRGITLEVERGVFGAVSVRRIISTTSRGAATIRKGGPDGAKSVLPEGATQATVYSIDTEGDGRGLARALCPGADAAFLVLGRVQAGRPMAMQATGRWPDGRFRHCVTLSYDYRGEWSLPPHTPPPDAA
ncbi:hypothetical protein HZ989_01295 [Brevundimonas sp. AJA228-03]|uniref:hypothetical protein n=1 Tax=Brevundimonas sp. AJA228-03 TaxID=2752515 RepID=UPI001ADFE11C|nr:hypothetical protein [Brevundimonas sp. AJA228-03]QTN19745.1 hypothetical protein HZ989_01295 [Brevundimonas sp. AJA228-03]